MSRALRALIRQGLERGLPSKAGFSRRQFLKRGARTAAIAAVGPALWQLGGCASHRAGGAASTGRRVVVIGGGFSGLACADTLARHGVEVTVLEASARPGGRVLSDQRFIPGRTVELGGEFIGANHPIWLAYARRFRIDLVEAPEETGESAILIQGKPLRGEAVDALYREIDQALAKIVELARPIDPVRPYNSPNAAELDRTSYFDFVNGLKMSDLAAATLLASADADNGVDARRMSLLGYLAMVAGGGYERYYTDSEIYRVNGGNDTLARKLADSLGENVRFNTPVRAIQRHSRTATVTTASGETLECDQVVLAIPPTIWPNLEIQPALDAKLRPQMGKNTKLLLAVKPPVWKRLNLKPEIVSDGLVSLTWVSCQPEGGEGSLTLFSGAEAAEKMCELAPPDRARSAIAAVAPLMPGLADTIRRDRFVPWPLMPRTKGSYSFPAPGQVTAFGPILVDGITDSLAPLHFAGEHTSYAFIGYMEGALSSGVRVAQAILSGSRLAA